MKTPRARPSSGDRPRRALDRFRGVAVAAWLLVPSACAPPVAVQSACAPGAPCVVTWTASGGDESLWLEVATTGGRDLTGPVSVESPAGRLARGTFSLKRGGIVG